MQQTDTFLWRTFSAKSYNKLSQLANKINQFSLFNRTSLLRLDKTQFSKIIYILIYKKICL